MLSGVRGCGKTALLVAFAQDILAAAQRRGAVLRGAIGCDQAGASARQTPAQRARSRWSKVGVAANVPMQHDTGNTWQNALDSVACFAFNDAVGGFPHLVLLSSCAVPELRDPATIMYRVCAEIKRVFGAETAVPTSVTVLAAQFPQWLAFAASKGALTLLLDGVEELSDLGGGVR